MGEEQLLEAHDLITAGEPDAALSLLNKILDEHMEDVTAQRALFMAGYIMMEAERWGLAYNIYKRCAELNPDISHVWSNMGMCLEEYDLKKSMECFQRARNLDQTNANAWANEGLSNLQLGDPRGCIDKSRKALELDPSLTAPKHNMGLSYLMLREWEQGWKLFYDTLGVKHREKRSYGLPDWNGEEGTVIVYGEQGVGDEIMYASCLPDLAERCNVILDCDSRLEGLFKRTFDFPVYGTRFKKKTPLMDEHKADYQCAIGQLPHFFRNSEESFPGTPYLKPDPERVLQWKALFDTFPGKKIGIAWSGGLPHTHDKRRTLDVEDLDPLLVEGNTYISLEYRGTPQKAVLRGIKDYPRATAKGGDIDDLAALIASLDVVICPCTTVVYIAGALGIPCHVMVPKIPGYRYHLDGQFPWYSSVTLHRQKSSWRALTKKMGREIYA